MPKEKNKKPEENVTIDLIDEMDTFRSCASTDCTGLIQTPPQTDSEYESYQDVYSFLASEPKEEDSDKK